MKARSLGLAAMLIAAAMLLSGCSQGTPGDAPATEFKTNSDGWANLSTVDSAIQFAKVNHFGLMESILEDGKVTRDEYAESFDAWASCMQKAGTVFSMPTAMWNPTSNQELIRAWTTNPPTTTKIEQAVCWNQYNFVKDEFQKQSSPHADPQLMSYVIGCIQDKGGPKDLTPAVDFEQLSRESPKLADTNPDSPISGCVRAGITTLYPGLSGYSLAF